MAIIPQALAHAVERHKAGRLQAVKALSRQILQAEPNQADATDPRGAIAHQVGKRELAVPSIERARALNRKIAELHNTLATVYPALRRLPEAAAIFRLDYRRSLRPERPRPLLGLSGFRFCSLQITPEGRPAEALRAAGRLDLSKHIRDFTDTAAFIFELDLIISVDNAVAHLAGAIGRPVWTLLSFQAEWRCGVAGGATPWYPSVRRFRQPAIGDWDPVVQNVATELPRARRPRKGRRAPRKP